MARKMDDERNVIQDIVKLTESLLVVAGGRPFLQALSFGGVERLSRRISHFLRFGSIHRDKYGEESCLPFLASKYGSHNKHLLRKAYRSSDDVIEMITERIVESNLCKALYELTCDNQSIEKNYDVPSGMRSKNCVKALLECASFLDEQDLDGLNSFQLDFKALSRPSSSNSGDLVVLDGATNNVQQSKLKDNQRSLTLDDSDDSKSSSTSLPDLTELGVAKFLSKMSVREGENVKNSSVPKYVHKLKGGHKRVASDTTVILEKNLYVPTPFPNVPEGEASSCSSWKYPPPDSLEQSWFDYIFSGKFSQFQRPLDVDNAHLILAETVIYHNKCQIKNSPLQLILPEKIKESSGEHLLLQLLSSTDDPYSLTAWDALRLLKDRGDPHAVDLFNETDYLPQTDNYCWRPPSDKINFALPPLDKGLYSHMKVQRWLCNNCGQKVNPRYANKFRFCYFYGKFCCTPCHTGKTHVLPSLIVYRWEFKECKVSDYALTVLTEMSDKPVIPIKKLNPVLINKVTRLQQAIQLREGAQKASTYLETCRLFKCQEQSLPMLVIEDASFFSLNELCSIRLGIYNNRLKNELDIAIKHILSCELCNAKAFHCERCRITDPIFPFQEGTVQCQNCFACYHKKCFKNPCTKCLRVRIRDKSLLTNCEEL